MDQFIEILFYPLFEFSGRTFTPLILLLIPIGIVIAHYLIRWTGRLLFRHLEQLNISPDLLHMYHRVYMILAYILVVLTVLSVLKVPVTAFAFVSGAIAIGVGFGAQNIINNFISGWILMWERPIRIDDMLEIGDIKGRVESINTRSTRIRRVDGVHMLIPNSHLLENMVVNWNLVDNLMRAVVRVGVSYGSPVQQVRDLIFQAASEHKDILQDPEPLVIFEDFGDSALIFDLYFWVLTENERDMRVIRSDVRFRIDELFHEHDITIAFPQQDVHLDGELKLLNPTSSDSS